MISKYCYAVKVKGHQFPYGYKSNEIVKSLPVMLNECFLNILTMAYRKKYILEIHLYIWNKTHP